MMRMTTEMSMVVGEMRMMEGRGKVQYVVVPVARVLECCPIKLIKLSTESAGGIFSNSVLRVANKHLGPLLNPLRGPQSLGAQLLAKHPNSKCICT